MLAITVGEIEEGKNSLVCIVHNDKEIIEQRPLGEMFNDFIMELKATETEERFNQFVEKIKGDLEAGIKFIEQLQMQVRSDSVH
jgi:hypothetical protein